MSQDVRIAALPQTHICVHVYILEVDSFQIKKLERHDIAGLLGRAQQPAFASPCRQPTHFTFVLGSEDDHDQKIPGLRLLKQSPSLSELL